MKTRILLVVLFLVCTAVAQNPGPEPAPWWMRVEETQTLALKWIAALSIVMTALITAIGALWMKVKEMTHRQDRASEDKRQLQNQVTDLAKQIPPPPSAVLIDQQSPLEVGSPLK